MSARVLGSYRLGEINLAANAALTTIRPVLVQLDLLLSGQLGLGALHADLAAQLQATLSAQAMLSAEVTDPLEAIRSAIEATVMLQAQLTATLALGLPAVNLEVSAQLSASLAVSAALEARLGALELLLRASLEAKLPAVDLVGSLAAHLSAGPVVLLALGAPTPEPLAQTGAELQALFAAGVGGIAPGQPVYGLVLLTPTPSVWDALRATLRAS